VGDDPREVEQRIEQTREHLGDTVSALAYKADLPSRLKGSVSDKKDAVTGRLAQVEHAITATTGETMETTHDGARRTIGIAQENPLGLAVGATAIGFVVGSLLPSTRVEEERIGPIAAQAREQVSDLASEAVEHGKQVAQDTVQAATETAKESGQEHATELRDSAQESTSQMAPSTSTPQG
jgi:gas vesicle protein